MHKERERNRRKKIENLAGFVVALLEPLILYASKLLKPNQFNDKKGNHRDTNIQTHFGIENSCKICYCLNGPIGSNAHKLNNFMNVKEMKEEKTDR